MSDGDSPTRIPATTAKGTTVSDRDPSSPQSVVERALELSRTEACMVLVEEHSSANLRWAGNSLTTNGVAQKREVTVIALARSGGGLAAGVVRRSGLRDDELADLVRAAEVSAAGAEPSEETVALLAPGDPGAASGGDWDAGPHATAIGVFGDFAPALGRAFDRFRAADTALYGYAEHTVTSSYFGSSTGLRLRHDQPTGTVELNAKSGGGNGAAHSTWVGRATRDFADVDVPALEEQLRRRLEWGRRRVDLPAGRYETLLPPSAVADLMIGLYGQAGGRDAAEGRSAFSADGGGTRIGERVGALPLGLRSDPNEPGLECAPFVLAGSPGRRMSAFDNGLVIPRTDWISGGELTALAQTRQSAALSGAALTPDVDNLVLEQPGATASLEEMIARTERGLLLNCLWYIRTVDVKSMLVTGLTRDGVYLVENGEVTGAVNNFRFNETPLGLLQRISEVGATVPALAREFGDYFPRTSMPPLRVPDFNMSTVSKAS